MRPDSFPKSTLRRTCAAVALCLGIAAAPAANAQADYTKTRYPVVLSHGLFGFANVGPVDYWYGIPSALRDGGATVFVTAQSAANSSEVRGEQLLAQLLQLKAAYGYTKFNLVGHSQGGQSIRYVATMRPDLVASVTSVGTPHAGTPVADSIASLTSQVGPDLTGALVSIVNGLAGLIGSTDSSGKPLPQDALGALKSLSTPGATAFNTANPAGAPTSACGSGPAKVNGIRYFSAGGTKVSTNVFDLSDPLLGLTSAAFNNAPNDGLVGKCSSHWGTVLRDDYPWNHLDEVNQLFGLRGFLAPDPVAFYRGQANRLKGLGL